MTDQKLIPFAASSPIVTLITDGACVPNPGPGAWAYALRFGTHYKEQAGYCPLTTNNRMELQAILEGLKALTKPCRVVVRSDSQIAINWCGAKAFRSAGKRAKHPEAFAMVEEFRRLATIHTISFEWVRGHDGDPDNERCDELCAETMRANR